ncbi:MAG: VapE family protein, partial [Ruminococcus sp.]|nr:VapE family protein [Ruminococcus sp.]
MDDKNRKKIDDVLHDKSQIEALQEAIGILSENYSDRVKVQGEERFSSLAAVYCIAEKNILSSTVFQFLRELDDTALIKELANNELSDLAEKQKKKIAFRDEIKHVLSERKKQEKQAEKQAKAEYLQIKAQSMPSYFGKQLNQCVVESVLSESLNIRVKLNQVTKKIDVDGSGKAPLLQLYSESNLINALPLLILDECKACEVSGISGSLNLIKSYLFNIADINRYNPIHDMLNEHKNNNPENLERIYKILNLEVSFDKLLVKKWLIQTVAFAFATYDNQVSTEGMLILQGKQGLAKTSFFRVIAGNPLWFNEGVCIDVSNKDSLIRAVSAWISELGEIDSTFKKDQSALKAFITSPLDRIRLPYAAAISDMPRTTSLCGTVNPDKFLKDETGNRRYWVIHVDKIDKKQLFGMSKEDVFNLWGYVYSLYLEDNKGYLLNDV